MTNAPDFTNFLSAPAGEAKKPPPLPGGDYQGIVKSYDSSVRSREKKTPGIEFQFTLTEWPDDVEEAEKEGIVLSSRTTRFTQWVTDGSTPGTTDTRWRLDELLRDHMGLAIAGKPYEECLAESVGTQVTLSMVQQINQKSGDTITVCDRVGPAA